MGSDEPFVDCRAHAWVTRTVPAGVDPVKFAIESAIAGPAAFEKQQGLHAPFTKSVADDATPPLKAQQVKVTLKDGVATVDFDPAARRYLEQAICAASSVASVFEFTLRQFREVREVEFAIGGEPLGEGDA